MHPTGMESCLFVFVCVRGERRFEKLPFFKIAAHPRLNNRCSLRIQDFPEVDEPTFYLAKSLPKTA